MSTITKTMIEAAQAAWGAGIVRIAGAHTVGDNFEQIARDHVETLYA